MNNDELNAKYQNLLSLFSVKFSISKEDPLDAMFKEILLQRQMIDSIMGEGIEMTIKRAISDGVSDALSGKIGISYKMDASLFDYDKLAASILSTGNVQSGSSSNIQNTSKHKNTSWLSRLLSKIGGR